MRTRVGGRMVRWSTTAVVAALLLTAGCTSEREPGTAPGTPAGSAPSVPAPSGDADGQQDAAAPTPPADVPAEPVASVPGVRAGMVLEVYRLARSGGTVTLTMAILNEGTEDMEVLQAMSDGNNDFDAGGVSLLDPVGLQRYMVLRDTEGACLCSVLGRGVVRVPAGERLHLSASFPAPPEDVASVTVETPSGSLAGVPVTQA